MLQPGTEIAGYRIVGVLGRGGMGRVYEAVQIGLERTVALKILRDDLGVDEAFRARFRREGRVQGAISHPHIVGVLGAGEVDGHLYIAMQVVRGATLKQMIAAGTMDARRTMRLLSQVADALDAAHEAGLTHRDVKPQNVLVGPGDHAYLADFGLTKALADSGGYTRTGQFVGTIDYISPEQISGEPATPASDVYALGAILYESLTGEVPFPRESEAAVLFAHIDAAPPRLSAIREDLPPDLDAVIARTMSKDPTQRPTSAGSVMEQARAALEAAGMALEAASTAPPPRASPDPRPVPADAALASVRETEEDFPPTMAPASRLIPPESDPSFTVPDRLPTTPDTAPLASAAPEQAEAEDEAAPREADRARERSRRRLPAARVLVAGVAVAAALAGLLAGRSGSEHPREAQASAALTGTTSNADIATRWPATWTRSTSSAAADALHITTPIALQTTAGDGAAFAAGLVDGPVTAGLLPTSLSSSLPKPERVRVGDLAAYRYEDVKLPGVDGPSTVLAAPTTAGVLAIACTGAGATAAGCDRIAAATTLRRGRPLDLGPDASYARDLGQTMVRLNQGRAGARERLAQAAGPKRQAAGADAAAAAYARAGRALRAMAPGPGDSALHAALRSAVSGSSKAYTSLASAARSASRSRYRSAATAVARSETRLQRALSQLRTAGYRVG